jgi:hypothetical protein
VRYTVSVLATLSLLIGSLVVGHAQETGLTAEALDNATYVPANTGIFGDSVQLVDGGYAKAGQAGGIAQRSYVFGDLNGDAADDAVALVVELLGCCASSANIVLAAYVNDSGAPIFAATLPLGISSDVKSVTVDSGVISVAGLKMGPNDPFCCPTQPFERQLTLQGNQLVDVSDQSASAPSDGEAPRGIEASLAASANLDSLKDSPGLVLLPPAGLQPFQGLPTPRVEAGDNLVQMLRDADVVYGVFWGGDRVDANAASIRGTRMAYDDVIGVAQDATCEATAAYCHHPKIANAQWGESEQFRGLETRGGAAVVGHATSGAGHGWAVSWLDQGTGVTYSLSLGGSALLQSYGLPTTFSSNNRAGAEKLAQLANELVQWAPQ